MLNKILNFDDCDCSVRELNECVRQGIPSAVFGVTEAFKYYLVSVIDAKVLYVVKDSVTAEIASASINQFSGKTAVVLPPKDEIVRPTRAFSKDGAFKRISVLDKLCDVDVLIATPDALMQTLPKSVTSLEFVKNSFFLNFYFFFFF